ncbi:MAG TPA: hypothetical protein VIK31_05930 [Propionibacteriaceae bacterium]
MTGRTVRLATALALAAAILTTPAAALANGWVMERGLLGGLFANAEWASPDVSGHWAVFMVRTDVPGLGPYRIDKVDLRTGEQSTVTNDEVGHIALDGDWVVYDVDGDIRARNLATGAVKKVTNDGGAVAESEPTISGKYVVWEVENDLDTEVWGRDISTMHPKFLIADGNGSQLLIPQVSGNRVAYRSELTGFDGQIMVKTIGSSAAAVNLTGGTGDNFSPSIGDHLVAWTTVNASGKYMIRYHDYDTGQTLDGPTSTTFDMADPRVSGDRILYRAANPGGTAMYVFDVRTWRASPGLALSFPLPDTSADELAGRISGTSCVYLNGGYPTWATLAVPKVTVGSVPTRIRHHGHIHLSGTVSDQGIRIGKARLRIEKYSGGRWLLVRTITASSNGSYSYQTPTLHAKTKFRVAYDGMLVPLGAGISQHFSAVSAVRTGWPY